LRIIVKTNIFLVELGGTTKWLSTVDILLFLYLNSCINIGQQAILQLT